MCGVWALLGAVALAGTPVVGVSGGWEEPTGQAYTGLTLALEPSEISGWSPVGQLTLGYGLRDRGPLGWLEMGLVRVVPHPEAVVRVGLAGRLTLGRGAYRWALDWSDQPIRWGAYPAVYGIVELEWNTEVAPYGVGLKAGVASTLVETYCQEGQASTGCATWIAGFGGGFVVYKRFEGGLSLEALVGPQTQLTLGWAL